MRMTIIFHSMHLRFRSIILLSAGRFQCPHSARAAAVCSTARSAVRAFLSRRGKTNWCLTSVDTWRRQWSMEVRRSYYKCLEYHSEQWVTCSTCKGAPVINICMRLIGNFNSSFHFFHLPFITWLYYSTDFLHFCKATAPKHFVRIVHRVDPTKVQTKNAFIRDCIHFVCKNVMHTSANSTFLNVVDFTIHRCGLQCRKGLHYHCLYCAGMLLRRDTFEHHLQHCKNTMTSGPTQPLTYGPTPSLTYGPTPSLTYGPTPPQTYVPAPPMPSVPAPPMPSSTTRKVHSNKVLMKIWRPFVTC